MYATVHEPLGLDGVAVTEGLRRVHLGMIDAVLAGEGTGRVAALAAHELDGTVAIVLPAVDLAVVEPRATALQLSVARRYVSDHLAGLPAPAPDTLAHEVAVTLGDEPLGAVLLLGRGHPHAEDILQLAALAAVTSVALEQGAIHTQARARLALLEVVRDAPPPHQSEIVARAKRLGCDLAGGASALCVRIADRNADWALALIEQEAPAALAAQRGDHVEALLPAGPGDARRLARRLRQRLPTGLAPLERDLTQLGAALRFAELAMAVSDHEDIDGGALLAGSWRLLLRTAARDPLEIDELIDVTIGPALRADAGGSADLVHTLRAYYAHDARMNATAAAIHAHRHTIGYRLGRIAELTGHDPQTPTGQSQLTLGLQALAVRRASLTAST